jgi:adenosylcobinamide kinase/adenosylcobinamide-phosphate guanylyltransferase
MIEGVRIMLHIVVGAAACGKSEYAESLAAKCFQKYFDESRMGKLYYVAAMKPYGDEALKRIERHRKLRAGKGFETLEVYTHIDDFFSKKLKVNPQDVFLIECMSNLLANEIYEPEGGLNNIADDIVSPIVRLSRAAGDVVVVTNDVFSDGRHFVGEYEETENYCRLLGSLNIMLAEHADTVTEVVCGIPNMIKRYKD